MDTGAKEAPRGFSQHSLILKKALKTFWPHRVAHSFSCFSLLARVAIWKRYPVFTGVAGWVNTDGVFSLLAERLMNLALGTGFFRSAVWWEEQTEANQERLEAIFSYPFLSFPSIKFRPTHGHLIKRLKHAGPVDPAPPRISLPNSSPLSHQGRHNQVKGDRVSKNLHLPVLKGKMDRPDFKSIEILFKKYSLFFLSLGRCMWSREAK